MSTFINRQKASSHTMPPGGIYLGVVKSIFENGTVTVFIPRLGINYGPLRIAGQSSISKVEPEQQVICGFLNSGVTEVIVISTLDQNPSVVNDEYVLHPEPVDVYRIKITSESVMKFAISIENAHFGTRSIVYKELIIIFDETSPYIEETASYGSTLPLGGDFSFDIRTEGQYFYITCLMTEPIPTRIKATRLFTL
jgi:hypothetical protein